MTKSQKASDRMVCQFALQEATGKKVMIFIQLGPYLLECQHSMVDTPLQLGLILQYVMKGEK